MKFALGTQLVIVLSRVKSHSTGKLVILRPGITEVQCI